MTKPMNFPQRVVERREGALTRLMAKPNHTYQDIREMKILAERTAPARHIRTKKDRTKTAKFSRP